jgi:hypothetical protein
LKSIFARALDRSLLQRGIGDCAADQTVAAVNHAGTSELGEFHFLFFARLEANRCSRWNVETHAECSGAIERERAIGFKKVVVAPDLDGAVAGILDEKAERVAAGIREDRSGTLIEKIFTRIHNVTGLDRES